MGELWKMIYPRGRFKVCTCKEYEAVEDLGGTLREINFSQLSLKPDELKFISEGFSSVGSSNTEFRCTFFKNK